MAQHHPEKSEKGQVEKWKFDSIARVIGGCIGWNYLDALDVGRASLLRLTLSFLGSRDPARINWIALIAPNTPGADTLL